MSNFILDAFYSLGKNINKAKNQDSTELEQGVVGPRLPELVLDMGNEEIAKLSAIWEKKWTESDGYQKWLTQCEENENYWLGKQYDKPNIDKNRSDVDNAIFEALETYLPQVTRRNPEAMIGLKNRALEKDPQAQQFIKELQDDLGDFADEVRLRLKLKKSARHWAIYLLGAIKMGWDMDKDMPVPKVIRAKKLILDPDATVDEDGYTGEYIGEHRKLQASMLISFLEANDAEEGAVKFIKDLVKEDLGTDVAFIEWWTDQYMCWTINKEVLLKKKNPHWNYDRKEAVTAPEPEGPVIAPTQAPGTPALPHIDQTELGTESEDATEQEPEMQTIPGFNHLPAPRKPYILLSVFNLGKQPMDDTSLIGQNLSNQDRLNKRNRQIDKNADSMNGGMVVSGERSGLSQQQSKGVTEALRKGGTVYIPAGAVTDAIQRMSAPELPATIYNQVIDTRNRIKDIFGTRGSSAAGLATETTVRGKIMNRTLDSDRIGGGFSEYLEQMADDVYNYAVQLMYVYSDKYAGQQHPKVNVSIKEGSLLPKDSTTIANQAIDLAAGGKMSLIDLYKRLDYPNAEELAANVWLEANAPELLFQNDPRVQQALQMKQQAAQQASAAANNGNTEEKPPSQSINFKDLPPEGKVQLAEKAGIHLHPEGIAAHDEVVAARKTSNPAPAVIPELGQATAQ